MRANFFLISEFYLLRSSLLRGFTVSSTHFAFFILRCNFPNFSVVKDGSSINLGLKFSTISPVEFLSVEGITLIPFSMCGFGKKRT